MKRAHKARKRLYECGAIAVETAIVIPILLVFLGLPSVYLAFYFLQYTAAQKAVHDAALYLSTAPRVEMTTMGLNGTPAALTLAREIIEDEMDGVVPDGVPLEIGFSCLYRVAGSPAMKPCSVTYNRDPNHTLAQLGVSIALPYINPLTGEETRLLLAPYAPIQYMGN